MRLPPCVGIYFSLQKNRDIMVSSLSIVHRQISMALCHIDVMMLVFSAMNESGLVCDNSSSLQVQISNRRVHACRYFR